jgi:hypothetical protein
MPRYLVERTFAGGLHTPINDDAAEAVASVVATNAQREGTWVHSYVLDDHAKTFCVYEGPSPQAIRPMAERAAYQSTSSPRLGSWAHTATPNSRLRLAPPSLPGLPTPMIASGTTARKVVTHASILAGGLLAATLAAVLIGPTSPAAAQVDPPAPNTGYTQCAAEIPSVSQPGVAPASPPLADPLTPIVVCTVEVAVPKPIAVANRTTEMLHLGVAAVLGATLAAASTATRRRRRPPPRTGLVDELLDDAHRLIDITDTVQSKPHDSPAVLTLSGRSSSARRACATQRPGQVGALDHRSWRGNPRRTR